MSQVSTLNFPANISENEVSVNLYRNISCVSVLIIKPSLTRLRIVHKDDNDKSTSIASSCDLYFRKVASWIE